MPQIHLITGNDRRRTWTREEKDAILAEAFAPGVCIREMSRRLGISTSLLYTWRKELWKPAPVGFSQVVAVPPNSESQGSLPPDNGEPVDEACIEIICERVTIRIPVGTSPELARIIVSTLVVK